MLTLQLERLRGGCAAPQSQDVKPWLLISLQALPVALRNLQQSCSLGWASGSLLGILLLPFAYFAPLYSLGLSLNIMALSSHLDQVESLCVLLSQHHLGQRLLVFSWGTWLPSCFIKSQFNREATCTVKRLLLIAFLTGNCWVGLLRNWETADYFFLCILPFVSFLYYFWNRDVTIRALAAILDF